VQAEEVMGVIKGRKEGEPPIENQNLSFVATL
jgi:hypothetical protein